jgi:hypothetical protein
LAYCLPAFATARGGRSSLPMFASRPICLARIGVLQWYDVSA